MNRFSVIAILSIVAAVGCESSPYVGETVDIVDGTYMGRLADGELANRVDLVDPASSLEVRFFEDEGELNARTIFRGEIGIGYVVGTYTLDGPEYDTVHGVTVDGDELWTEYDASVKMLEVYGLFDSGRTELMLEIESLGTLWLDREEDPEEDEEEEGDDV